MILWDHEMREGRARERLEALPALHVVSFAAAALSHATRSRLASADATVDAAVAATLDLAWRTVGGDQSTAVELVQARVRSLMPDEDARVAVGVAESLDAASRLCSCIKQPTSKAALGVADYAYQALTCWVLEPVDTYGDEARFVAAERASEACRSEIKFHLAYLGALESLRDESEPTWDRVTSRL
jgi:hypothetical protein